MSGIGLHDARLRQRILWWFDAGLDTRATAEFLGAPERAVADVLSEERGARHRARRAERRRFEAMHAAWDAGDVDRNAVAGRFGYRDARAASAALSHWRGCFGLRPKASTA
ncbi:hypothetical protein [uncultured Methylobacterium sp.]|uniref:hypothetical protein n=1 Tax=uncultured Methylobacterium sp. TaxID=157278 RepID=UPI0035CB6D22